MIKFNFKNSNVKIVKNNSLEEEIKNMNLASKNDYQDLRCSINLAFDENIIFKVKELVKEKKQLKPDYLIIVGIGGSNLGTLAVQEAVLSRHYNLLNPKIKVLYADTVDSDLINNILSIVKNKKVLINLISKSGTTTETIANFNVLYNKIKLFQKNIDKHIVVTTDKDSKLWFFAKEKNFSILEIPDNVGGRFSVFSPVGLFPLAVLDINIDGLLEGARFMRDICLKKDNPASISALIRFLSYKKSININDFFFFSSDLESLGKWYRQLIAESIGKEFNKDNKKVNIGITPTVSIGSTDLHSMAQLYLGGPYDKLFTFVSVKNNFFPDKTLNNIMDAILKGTKIAFKKNNLPFIEISLKDKFEFSLGQFLQFAMIEIMYLGSLFNINPFDQPSVESYKKEAKKFMKS